MAPRILIVEDDRAARLGLQALLQQAGYQTIVAADFREGRRALEHDEPDLLIADLRLGGFNGLQLLHVNPRPIPAIVVTGYPDEVLQAEARQLGAEYLVKPVSPVALLETIERLLIGAPGRDERRRWPRKRLKVDVPAEVDSIPARVLDLSYGGVKVEVYRPGGGQVPPTVRLAFPVNDLSFEAHMVWGNPDRAGRWLCGAEVIDGAIDEWRRLVDTV